MANRVVTNETSERTTYNNPIVNGRRIVNGDIIIDTFTNESKNVIFYTDSETVFSGARLGATIWIKNPNGNPISAFWLRTTDDLEWAISDVNNPVVITALEGQVIFRKIPNNDNPYNINITNLAYVSLWGETESHPGMRNGWGPFKHGTFGIQVDRWGNPEPGQNNFTIGGDFLSGIEVIGVESIHGFARYRSEPTAPGLESRRVDYFRLKRSFLHTGETGEGIYIGSTKAPPYALFENVLIEDVLCTRAAAEGFQMQHMVTGSRTGIIRNTIWHANGADWKAAFQNFQSAGLQLSYDEGDILFENSIVDGWGSNGLTLFKADEGLLVNNKKVRFRNVLWLNGRNRGIYFNANDDAIPIEFNQCEFGEMVDNWEETYPNEVAADHHMDVANDIDLILKYCKYRNNKTFYTGTYQGNVKEVENNGFPTQEYPEYLNSDPISQDTEKYEVWHEEYADWTVNQGHAANTKIEFNQGDTVFNTQDKRFYRCLITHTSSASTRPDLDNTNWLLLTWDKTNGVANDKPGWDFNNPQSIYPPDDYRLAIGNTHNTLGRGLSSNPTPYTFYNWQYSEDDGSNNPDGIWVNIADIESKKLNYTPPTGLNRHYRRVVTVKNTTGQEIESISNTIQVI
jgi:hypothetical protein